jgi:replicative DNA helicase
MTEAAPAGARVPPFSLEAEQAVLGGLMLNNDAFDEVADRIDSGDFYRPENAIVYRAIHRLRNRSEPIDAVTVSQELRAHDELDAAGGLRYLMELTDNTPVAQNTTAYARIVRDRSLQRRIVAAAQRIADFAYEPGGHGIDEVLSSAEAEIFNIEASRAGNDGFLAVEELLTRTVNRLERLMASKSAVTGLPTGFVDLDRLTAGLQPGELVIVAGRPSMGKTAFALNIVEHALMAPGDGATLVFSLEMPGEQLMMRLLSSLSRIDQTRMRTGNLEDHDWDRVVSSVAIMQGTRLFIDETPSISPAAIRARARRVAMQAKQPLKLIVVDYLQLMRGDERFDNRVVEISEISRSLKSIAREMKCPLIALSQLNRAVESRPNKRPVMSDLRESGAIEQDADVIVFLYRDEVYNENSADKGAAEIIIGKQRNGPLGTVKLAFRSQLTKFENLAPDRYGGGPLG